MKHFFMHFFAVVTLMALTACSSSDDEPGMIELGSGQTDKVACWANTASDRINFKAAASWTAHVETVSRAEGDWIHLDRTSGSAGDVTITFTLDPNTTGNARTAYIVIVCEDTRVTITITQSAESDPDAPANRLDYVFKNGYYMLDYDGNLLTYNKSTGDVIRITGNEGYCVLTYNGGTVSAKSYRTGETTPYKNYTLTLDRDRRFAVRIDADDSDGHVAYDLEYTDGYLTKCVEHHREEMDYETSELKWSGGNVTQVVTKHTTGTVVTDFKYSNMENIGGLMLYDTQLWIDLDEMSVFYFCGLLGLPTKHLIESSSSIETENADKWQFSNSYEYSFDDNGLPVKMTAKEYEEGYDTYTSYSDFSWTRF